MTARIPLNLDRDPGHDDARAIPAGTAVDLDRLGGFSASADPDVDREPFGDRLFENLSHVGAAPR